MIKKKSSLPAHFGFTYSAIVAGFVILLPNLTFVAGDDEPPNGPPHSAGDCRQNGCSQQVVTQIDAAPLQKKYTVGTACNPVTFSDPHLEAAIRSTINKAVGIIYQADLTILTSLVATDKGISSIAGLEHCTSLQYLDLRNNSVSDLYPLANLTSLKILNLGYNDLSNISALAGLPNLSDISIDGNRISDISALERLPNLHTLCLQANRVVDISSLVANPGLRFHGYVALWSNDLDINPGSQNLTDIVTLLNRDIYVDYRPQRVT